MPLDERTLIGYNAIADFLEDIGAAFEDKKNKPLARYRRLAESTGITNKAWVHKNFTIFKTFTATHRLSIVNKDESAFDRVNIVYKDDAPKISLPLGKIFKWATPDEKRVIWKHLLTILEITNPDSGARDVLQEFREKEGASNEEAFLQNVMGRLEDQVGNTPTDNPMAAVMNMMSGGFMQSLMGDMQSGVESGDLDLGKLMGTVHGLLGSVGGLAPGGAESNPFAMLSELSAESNVTPAVKDDSPKDEST